MDFEKTLVGGTVCTDRGCRSSPCRWPAGSVWRRWVLDKMSASSDRPMDSKNGATLWSE